MILDYLKNYFPPEDIEWRVQNDGVKNGKAWAIVVPYVTNRAIMDRLDNVCGPDLWKNEFVAAPNDSEGQSLLCGISILCECGWVTKWDGASNTQVEAVKGGISDSMKRAGVQWGIGRYLYKFPVMFANIGSGEHSGKAYESQSDRKAKRNPTYYKWSAPSLPKWAIPGGNKAASKVDKSEPRLIEVVRSAISKGITLKTFTQGQFAAFLKKEYNAEILDYLTKPQLEAILDTVNGWRA